MVIIVSVFGRFKKTPIGLREILGFFCCKLIDCGLYVEIWFFFDHFTQLHYHFFANGVRLAVERVGEKDSFGQANIRPVLCPIVFMTNVSKAKFSIKNPTANFLKLS